MKLIVRKIHDKYLVSNKNVYGSAANLSLVINGQRYDDVREAYLLEEPKTIKVVLVKHVVQHYVNKEDPSETLSVEEHAEIFSNLNSCYNPDAEKWDSLAHEFEFRKFVDKWDGVIKDEEVLEDLSFVIYDITGRADNVCITPYRFLGKEQISDDKALYLYTPKLYERAKIIASAAGLTEFPTTEFDSLRQMSTAEKTWSVPSHSQLDLRFLKVNNQYAAGDGIKTSEMTGTWDECYQRYERDQKLLEDIFSVALRKIDAMGEKPDVAAVMSFLENTRSAVSSLEVKKLSISTKSIVLKNIHDFIRKL